MDEKYQRVRVLGKGSFGKAYLVKNTVADELCVVKQMETSMMSKKEKEEAVKEAILLKRMDHKNIVRFQEVFMTRKGRLCIVMDYADGGDIHMEIKNRRGLLIPEQQVLEWFVQICFALRHVHERKVLHRDLKTQNVFLMSTGQVKLGDFGIAKVLDATKDYAKTMVGTPYYLSPEIIEDNPYNFKSDIWSFGVVLYEMATLRHPFDAESLVILASKILRDEFPPPDAMYSADLQELIRCMLCKEAKMRPSIREVMARRFLRGHMEAVNARYRLDVDVSDIPCEPPPTAAAAGVPASPASIAAEGADAQHCDGGSAGGDDEYDEDFEDYSEPEDCAGEAPQSDLQRSVANLRLAPAPIAAAASGAAPAAPAATSLHAGDSPSGDAVASGGPPSPGQSNGGGIRAKADSLRMYLQSQVSEVDFSTAYALVRSSSTSGAGNAELQRQVGDVIGADKAPELLTLFQLLCFLEDVAAGKAHSDSFSTA